MPSRIGPEGRAAVAVFLSRLQRAQAPLVVPAVDPPPVAHVLPFRPPPPRRLDLLLRTGTR